MVSENDLNEWIDEFEEELLCEYAIDIGDTGLSREELHQMSSEPAYQAVARYAEKFGLTNKSEGRYL